MFLHLDPPKVFAKFRSKPLLVFKYLYGEFIQNQHFQNNKYPKCSKIKTLLRNPSELQTCSCLLGNDILAISSLQNGSTKSANMYQNIFNTLIHKS